jgi:hypothetical protein
MRQLGYTALMISALLIAFLSFISNRVRTEVKAEYSNLPTGCQPNCPTDISAIRK